MKATHKTGAWLAGAALLVVLGVAVSLWTFKQVEDHPQLRMLSARDGNRGVALARAHLPDVILMDINLPDMSGSEVLKVLHDDPATAHILIIALSANAMPLDVEKGLAAGFFRYLTKPIKVNEFMEALDSALEPVETERGDAGYRGVSSTMGLQTG